MAYYETISPDEAQALDRLLDYATRMGWTVSVNDGGEWTAKNIQPAEVPAYVATTADDVLLFRNTDGEKMGVMFLVYGNSGEELIADHSANDAMEAAWNYVQDGLTV